MRAFLIAMAATLLVTATAWAVDPSEMLADPKLEARAESVGKGLRCLVCQSESIEESSADLAHDLRVIVRERIKSGDTDQQVVDYVHSRYGDYVLLNPPFKPYTLVLWIGPLVFLILGLLWARTVFGKSSAAEPESLSEDESKRLKSMVEKDKP